MRAKALHFLLIIPLLALLPVGCGKSKPEPRHIKMVAKRYTYEPNVVRVKKGELVALDITTADRQHGIESKELGIDESIQPGHTTTVTFTPEKTGEFKIECDIICGPGHDDMQGKIIVEE